MLDSAVLRHGYLPSYITARESQRVGRRRATWSQIGEMGTAADKRRTALQRRSPAAEALQPRRARRAAGAGTAQSRRYSATWRPMGAAGARAHGLTYSQFMNGLKRAGIDLDRKVLSDLAITEPASFTGLVEQAQAALAQA